MFVKHLETQPLLEWLNQPSLKDGVKLGPGWHPDQANKDSKLPGRKRPGFSEPDKNIVPEQEKQTNPKNYDNLLYFSAVELEGTIKEKK